MENGNDNPPDSQSRDPAAAARPAVDPAAAPRAGGRRVSAGFSFDRFYRLNRRVLIWVMLAFVLWLLRSFFSLIFLTFVIAFVASPVADFFGRRLKLNRHVAICLTFAIFVAAIIAGSALIVPQVAREAFRLVGNLPETEQRLLELRDSVAEKYPAVEPILMNYLRSTIPDAALAELDAEDVAAVEVAADAPDDAADGTPGPDDDNAAARDGPADTDAIATADVVDAAEQEIQRTARRDAAIIHLFINHQIRKLADALPGIIRMMWSGSATVLLALFFSFLISLDISRLGQEVRNLRDSRLRAFHGEVAQPVMRFAYVVGRAVQVQAMIAVVNTVLTLVGLTILGVPSLAVISMIVFLGSFVPVLGVFLSTIPIVLVAVNSGGLDLAILCVLLVIIIHAIETYVLNPLIYGKQLKLNPVVVLIILFVGYHAFGIWGMLLGVPVAYYFIHDVFGVPIWNERHLSRKRLFQKADPEGTTVPVEEESPKATNS